MDWILGTVFVVSFLLMIHDMANGSIFGDEYQVPWHVIALVSGLTLAWWPSCEADYFEGVDPEELFELCD